MGNTGGMVDVGNKDITVRVARAQGTVSLGAEAFGAVIDKTCTWQVSYYSSVSRRKG